MFSYLCYKCLNEKGNVIFLTLIMLRKYKMIMISIVLLSMIYGFHIKLNVYEYIFYINICLYENVYD